MIIFLDPVVANRLVDLIDHADLWGIPATEVVACREALAASGTERCPYCILSQYEHGHDCPRH